MIKQESIFREEIFLRGIYNSEKELNILNTKLFYQFINDLKHFKHFRLSFYIQF